MIEQILLAVDGSPDSLVAARVSIELAGALHARLRVLYVSADHVLDLALEHATGRPVAARRADSDSAILQRVSDLAAQAGVVTETELRAGEVGPLILSAARDWPADLVVLGKSTRLASGEPYVGAHTRHVLEFADQPVLVVPARRR